MPPTWKPDQRKAAADLLKWYRKNRRDLPWRRTRDPYAIWLSEIMLQQTTVRTVTPRWSRFLERWPSIADLADAPLDDVLHEWTGLGYYARARNLHKAAGIVAREFEGRLPESFDLLLALPGMGPYT
ncbi:MAG: A/G-specific adenine glycosylase, partial [Candidatus Sumerlaeia bacterium]|nr:A/G-specific adenine glycosylase [Candidatus Sumerlaeia bacterium]